MTQTFNVVRCFSCSTFQVQQVKKAKKWACKVCGEKQSLVKVYGQGTGAECRQHVQKLNFLRQDMDEKEYQMAIDSEYLDDSEETEETDNHSFTSGSTGFMKLSSSSPSSNSSSKWSKFLPCESDAETSHLQMEESDYVEKYNKDEKSLQEFYKFTYQEKRKNPFSEVPTRASLSYSDHLMKRPRTAMKNNFQLSSVNCNKSNNWSHSVSIESRRPGTNLVTCHQPVHFEHSSSNLDTLTSDKSCKMSPSNMDLSQSRKDISHSYMFNPSYTSLPMFTECKKTNIKDFKDAQCDENGLLWMAKPQSHLYGDCREEKDFPEKDLVVSPWNIENGLFKERKDFPEKDLAISRWNVENSHSKSLNCENELNLSTHTDNTLTIEKLLQRNNCDTISLSSSNVNKQKTDGDSQILPASKLSSNKQNNSLPFSNNLDKGKLAVNSTESNSLKNIFQLDENEVDFDF